MKMWWRNVSRRDSTRPLIENNNNNNNDLQDGYEQVGTRCDNTAAQNNFNSHEERRLQSGEEEKITLLAELLGVAPDANTSEDVLIQRSVSQHFPKPPADVNQNLHLHLSNVQETVHNEFVRLGPLLESMGLIECLIDCYHRQTFDHLDGLLLNISTSQNSLVLMKWVLHTYLSQELFGHPDLQVMDPIKKVDLLLFTEWITSAENKLLENVQKEIRGFLETILETERGNEAHNELYVDTIQCIDAMTTQALKISRSLSDHVQEVCFQELLMFLTRYTTEQTEILEKRAKMDEPETKHFFKTLNNCKQLKQHVQTKTKSILLKETVEILENMEAFTLKLLMRIVADSAESHLKKYFKSENKEFFFLIEEVQSLFFELSCYQDIQERVMDEAYKLIEHIYLKHLIQRSQRKLSRQWSRDVGQTVAEDAELLHKIISDLVPGVQQCNLMLLKVEELLDCKSIETWMLTVGSMQNECCTWSEDLELLPALLRWKGLSQWQISEVLTTLEDLPGYQPRPRSGRWCSCFTGL